MNDLLTRLADAFSVGRRLSVDAARKLRTRADLGVLRCDRRRFPSEDHHPAPDLDPDDMDRLFDPFQRKDDVRTDHGLPPLAWHSTGGSPRSSALG
ncbi:hypothetical protein [Jannaschia donghaensis]|uniref:hypothetical protein n=1 Tax=Jannaschia donghaensis TaxID=420998 RepID=UPI001187695F|nr:hypothetical protein [Jannaschia donghaensis]